MTNLTKDELASLITSIVAQVMQGQTVTPKPAFISSPVDKLAQRDAAIRAGFARRGIKDVTLMNRADPKQSYDVKPYGVWLSEGWQVRKGQKSIKGLFHQSQCDRIVTKATAKPAISSEQKTLFETAKKVLAKKKGKLTPVS
jgi:hypothetical protein